MIMYQCKMCGGNLNIAEGSKVVTCDYCRTQQTVPFVDDEKRANLYNRANHFRQNGEFDKAMGIYEHILSEDTTDAESYWSLVLCKFGIQYVEDPASKERKPTVNRVQTQSVLQDTDYKMALEHAELSQKQLYEKEAAQIDAIQKEILQIANNEAPYDIFISYKEKAPSGERTKSSVLAQDIYHHLTKEGYRVFFSRISLEDKIGQKYEPYIYSALKSSKVMLVIATEKEEFVAPWVRNEWSRFLTMMREDTDKKMIPCFRDMNIDDLPNEFQILQSQDMSKIGFEQDLMRGIAKVVRGSAEVNTTITPVMEMHGEGVLPLERMLKNADTYMKLQNYEAAYQTYQNITNVYPEDYRGWWGMIQTDTRDFGVGTCSPEKLADYGEKLGYVAKLAPENIYHEKCACYVQFLEHITETQAENELKEVENRKTRYQQNKDGYEQQIGKLTEEEKSRKMALEEEKKRVTEKRKEQLKPVRFWPLKVIGAIFATPAILMYGLYFLELIDSLLTRDGLVHDDFTFMDSQVLGIVVCIVVCIVGLWCIRETFRAINYLDRKLRLREFEAACKAELAALEDDSRKLADYYESERASCRDFMEKLDIRIKECDTYLTYGAKEIAKIITALHLQKVGISVEYHAALKDLRDKVLHGEEIPAYMAAKAPSLTAVRQSWNGTIKSKKGKGNKVVLIIGIILAILFLRILFG